MLERLEYVAGTILAVAILAAVLLVAAAGAAVFWMTVFVKNRFLSNLEILRFILHK